jgi:hypothetical protein
MTLSTLLGVLAVAYVIGRLIYWFVIDRQVPGGWDRRFGTHEALPPDVGQWKNDVESDEGRAAARTGLERQVRLFHDPHRGGGTLIRQVRYRNPATNVIVRVDADEPVPRRRTQS